MAKALKTPKGQSETSTGKPVKLPAIPGLNGTEMKIPNVARTALAAGVGFLKVAIATLTTPEPIAQFFGALHSWSGRCYGIYATAAGMTTPATGVVPQGIATRGKKAAAAGASA